MHHVDNLHATILSLVRKFIQRQSVVLKAMRELRPDLVMRYYDHIGTPAEWAALRNEYVRRSQTGYWGDDSEWIYLLHGQGCRLTHVHNKEVIEWDVGDLSKFNVDWFIRYLQSLFWQKIDDDLIVLQSALPDTDRIKEMSDHELADQRWKWKKQLEPIFEQLCELGYLSKGSSYTYRLIG